MINITSGNDELIGYADIHQFFTMSHFDQFTRLLQPNEHFKWINLGQSIRLQSIESFEMNAKITVLIGINWLRNIQLIILHSIIKKKGQYLLQSQLGDCDYH